MDTSSVPLLDHSLQYQWSSDTDLSSISSPEMLSPVLSMDSSLSPSYQQLPQSTPKGAKCLKSSPCSLSGRGRKTGRTTRIRSKQRESASEKEKLRMRDLTKALHHLRSYLPPSVAPVGQTLTKIETLRLTIRYISYLSAQLGLSEEVLFQRREQVDTSASGTSSPDFISYLQNSSAEEHLQGQNLYPGLCYSQNRQHSGYCSFEANQLRTQYTECPQGDMSMEGALQSPPVSKPSCQGQVCGPFMAVSYSNTCRSMMLTLAEPDHTLYWSMPVSHGTPWPRCHPWSQSFSGPEEALRSDSPPLRNWPTTGPVILQQQLWKCSSLSPTSSVDSFCFSLVSLQAPRNEQDALNSFLLSSTVDPQPSQQMEILSSRRSSSSTAPMKKSRSRYPSKKRQTASEREKLRMRDLTKALQELRTYLPPSVVPAGQALTKIETLRLTIQYISYLSEQLGLSQEVLEQTRSSGFVEQVQPLSQFSDQPTALNTEQIYSLQHLYQV
ncbi:hypothetical protein GOODEAATRI_020163 [Goodea atripinnis]|uniref:BHLH domain-containing protein n=1 Tax=Goodea atripinnis TaxID=208336 RepID=A0ABV0MTN3_9TELE